MSAEMMKHHEVSVAEEAGTCCAHEAMAEALGSGGSESAEDASVAEASEVELLRARVSELEEEVKAARRSAAVTEALAVAGAKRVGEASAAVERKVSEEGRELASAVKEVMRERPELFGVVKRASGVMGSGGGRVASPLAAVAEEAARTGDRGLVLRYLRMKRGA